jgi:hypothetical protein
MKRIKILFSALLFSTVLLIDNASAGVLPFAFGFRGNLSYNALTYSGLKNGYSAKSNFSTGYGIGPYVRLGLKSFYVDGAIEYNHKTTETVFSGPNNFGTTQSYNMSTLDIPVTFGVRFIKLGSLDLRAFVGVSSSSVMSEKCKYDGDRNQNAKDFEGNTYGTYGNYILGIGGDVSILNVDLRYVKSYTDITKPEYTSSKAFPGAIQLCVGIRLIGGK